MADIFLQNGIILAKVSLGGLFGSLISIPKSDFKNSRWLIQYGGDIFTKTNYFPKVCLWGLSGSLILIPE